MGRGPQGEGLYVGNIINTDDTVSFALYSTLTNELVWQSPNLAPVDISFESADWRDLVPGVHADLDITVKRGGVTKTHTAYIPAGQPGSIVYLLDETLQRTADDTYTTTISKLTVYGRSQYPSKPTPRPNDIVFFNWHGDDGYGFAFGTIEDVGGTTRETASSDPVTTSTNVVFTARTFVKVPPVTIGQNGHWFVDGVDTGMAARGEKGDKGDKGDAGPRGLKGEKGDKGDTGSAGTNATVRVGSTVQLEPGAQAYVADTDPSESNAVLEFGIPEGKPATIPEVVYTALDPDEQGSVTIEQISSNANSYRLNIRLPRGEDGKSLDVQHGIWTPYNLPDFDETPINTAFVVDDGDNFIDLYIRGRIAHDAEDGGPWTVIEDLFRYSTDYKELDGSPIVWNETTQEWEYGNGFEVDYLDLENTPLQLKTAKVPEKGAIWTGPGVHSEGRGSGYLKLDGMWGSQTVVPFIEASQNLGFPKRIALARPSKGSQNSMKVGSTTITVDNESISVDMYAVRERSSSDVDTYKYSFIFGKDYRLADPKDKLNISLVKTSHNQFTDIGGSFDLSDETVVSQIDDPSTGQYGYYFEIVIWARTEFFYDPKHFEIDGRTPAVPAVWESDGDLDIWGNIINKVFATQTEVNAAVDAVIASRS